MCTGKEMRILHNAFLWGYSKAPELVRGVGAGDKERSALLGQWLADLDATLHVHHETEDELLWGKLEQRAPACALHVGQMRAQHAQVQGLLHQAEPLRESWRASADPATGEKLAAAYDQIFEVLKVHLRREVVEVVPVAEKVLTPKEWQELGKHSMGVIPKSRLLPQLGYLLANSSPADRAEFFAALPPPIRMLYRAVGKRQFAKQYKILFPGQPVPATI
jgi:hypothetical protein